MLTFSVCKKYLCAHLLTQFKLVGFWKWNGCLLKLPLITQSNRDRNIFLKTKQSESPKTLQGQLNGFPFNQTNSLTSDNSFHVGTSASIGLHINLYNTQKERKCLFRIKHFQGNILDQWAYTPTTKHASVRAYIVGNAVLSVTTMSGLQVPE